YRLLPAPPWQLDLAARRLAPAFADGRLLRLGTTAFDTWPTAAARGLDGPGHDLAPTFSLAARLTNDIRRLWPRGLRRRDMTGTAARTALAAFDGPAAWRGDRGHRTAAFADDELAVVVRDGMRGHLLPGTTPYLADPLAEGFDGNPLAAAPDPAAWWEAYLSR